MKEFESSDIIKELVNFVLPELIPYELSFYLKAKVVNIVKKILGRVV